MENPLKIRRLQAGWTQDDLARYAGVTHDNVVRNEQGLFNRPSPAILGTIADYFGEDAERITAEYTAWIANQRRSDRVRSMVRRSISFPQAGVLTAHPFLLWRIAIAPGISRIAFCQMLCIHPATVLKYEKGEQRTMPSQIKFALSETGMDANKINRLAQIGSEYFVHERRRRATATYA